MNFSFSLYDMLANVVPGALQLVAVTYIGIRFGSAHANRAYLQMHFNTLVDSIVLYKPGCAVHIDRVSATGTMLRNTVVPVLNVVGIVGVELSTSARPTFAGNVLGSFKLDRFRRLQSFCDRTINSGTDTGDVGLNLLYTCLETLYETEGSAVCDA